MDIPEVDTILLLRPTESLTIFLQQIGRGLRLNEEKDCCTIFDFVGQAHKNYNFEERFCALLGRTRHSVEKEIEAEFPHLPSGSHIHLEKVAREHILNNVRSYFTSGKKALINRIASFEGDSGKEATLRNFIDHYKLTLESMYKYAGTTWARLCASAGVISNFQEPDEIRVMRLLKRVRALDALSFVCFIKKLVEDPEIFSYGRLTAEEKQMFLMLYYDMCEEESRGSGDESGKTVVDVFRRNPVMTGELIELLNYLSETIDVIGRKPALDYPCALDIHCSYTRDEILSALDFYSFDRKVPPREGVCYIRDKKPMYSLLP